MANTWANMTESVSTRPKDHDPGPGSSGCQVSKGSTPTMAHHEIDGDDGRYEARASGSTLDLGLKNGIRNASAQERDTPAPD